MSLKLKFVEQARGSGANIAALCREYGISRQTGHKWLRRYHEDGPLGLVEQSRRPRSSYRCRMAPRTMRSREAVLASSSISIRI